MVTPEGLKDCVHAELEDVGSSLRPPTSPKYARLMPDPEVLEILLVQVLAPILSGVVSSIVAHWVTTRSGDERAATILRELEQIRETLQNQSIENAGCLDARLSEAFDSAVSRIVALRSETAPVSTDVDRNELERTVASVLLDYHLGPETSRRKAQAIVERVTSAIESNK